ncbi:MAG TPA: FHA domain-containing protein [Vicinamibacterales bacterium]|nr:FHA domain-containing protein [Vicinamibacterales bacterium]
MPKLILKFDDRELSECAVGTHAVSIGRLPDNTLVIDNPAVSGRHARVYREGNHYVLEDLKSTNGTFVNHKPIARHTLLEGDTVLVGKHTLVFTQRGGEQESEAPTEEPLMPAIGGTRFLDTQKQKELLLRLDKGRTPPALNAVVPKTAIPTPQGRIGTIKVVSGNTGQSEYVLAAITTMIGKADTAQIRLKGWFKPKVAAAIARKGDGFTITPMGAKLSVNGERINGRRDLASGDLIEVSGVRLQFKLS